MFTISESKKKEGRYCCAYACYNKPVKKKGGLCHKHYAKLLKKRDKIAVRYNQMRSKATQRNLKIHFTLEEFRLWCKRTNYLSHGYRGKVATIDRRCNLHGYYLWNMQILSLRNNTRKGNRFKGDEFDCPF